MANSVDRMAQVLVCGLATVDIVARPVELDHGVQAGRLVPIDQIEVTTGGIVSNSGIAFARWGIPVAAIACVGADPWAEFIQATYEREGLSATGLIRVPNQSSSATIVLVDEKGQRSFLFCRGAAPHLTFENFESRYQQTGPCSWVLFGYFSLFDEFDRQLPAMVETARRLGCKTALDSAGQGGTHTTLQPILPHLDLYVPSFDEAVEQTGRVEPRDILRSFRDWGARGIVGLKLGSRGAILSPHDGEYIDVAPVVPRDPIVDTTGAGDAFYAGLIAGLLRGLNLSDAGRLAAAAGAMCVTGVGATSGLRSWDETLSWAQISVAHSP